MSILQIQHVKPKQDLNKNCIFFWLYFNIIQLMICNKSNNYLHIKESQQAPKAINNYYNKSNEVTKRVNIKSAQKTAIFGKLQFLGGIKAVFKFIFNVLI